MVDSLAKSIEITQYEPLEIYMFMSLYKNMKPINKEISIE